jgi:hypothetical protein
LHVAACWAARTPQRKFGTTSGHLKERKSRRFPRKRQSERHVALLPVTCLRECSFLAEDDADAWLVLVMPQKIIHCGQVEIHLASELRFELLNFEVKHNETAESKMIKN